MTFPEIHSNADPEKYSWELDLSPTQELRQVDERDAAVYYAADNQKAFDIPAESAHDAAGARVPTTLEVVGNNEITLIVHHRAGDPEAGGEPFDYPILAGEGWEGGFQTTVVQGPPDEMELREQREARERQEERERRERIEREERAEREAKGASIPAAHCRVPDLRGATLAGARNRLRRAHCRLGSIAKAPGVTASAGRVVGQGASPGNSLGPWAKVSVRLGSAASSSRR